MNKLLLWWMLLLSCLVARAGQNFTITGMNASGCAVYCDVKWYNGGESPVFTSGQHPYIEGNGYYVFNGELTTTDYPGSRYELRDNATGTIMVHTMVPNGSYTFGAPGGCSIAAYEAPCETNRWSLLFNVRNTTDHTVRYAVTKDGAMINPDMSVAGAHATLSRAGNAMGLDRKNWEYKLGPCESTNGYAIQEIECRWDEALQAEVDCRLIGAPIAGKPCYDCVNGTNGAVANIGTNVVPVMDMTGTNNPILFSAAAETNVNAALKQGFGALYNQNAAQTDAIRSAGDKAAADAAAGLAADGVGYAGISNEVRAVRVSVTNALAAIITNNTPYAIGGSMTNAGSATTAANAGAASTVASADGVIGGIGSAPSGGGGSAGGLSLELAGHTMNFDPEVVMPGAMGYVKALITLVVTIAFAFSMGVLFRDTASTYASAQTGGVPNLEVFGNNPAGAIMAPLVATGMVVIWIAVFTVFFGIVTSKLSGMGGLGLPTNPSGIATYLLFACVPVNLILSLAWTRVIAYFTMAKVIVVAASASRFLIGH